MSDYPFFPMFVDLSRLHVLVVGGGRIAARRVGTLVRFCPSVTVVAPRLHPDVSALADAGELELRGRDYLPADLDGADLVLACTDDAALNAEIAVACRARGIPVNVASDRSLCDFLFPGVAQKDHLVAGVTAGGRDHRLARRVTQAIRDLLEREY